MMGNKDTRTSYPQLLTREQIQGRPLVRLYVNCKYDVRFLIKSCYYVMDLKEDKEFRLNHLNGEQARKLELELEMAMEGFKEMCGMVGADPGKVIAVVRPIRKRELYSMIYDDFAFKIDNVASRMRKFFAAETDI